MATEEIEEENPKKKLNKSGNRRGIDSAGNFKNNPEKASESSKKANRKKGAATQAITRSPAIKEAYRSRAITPEIQGYIFNQLTEMDPDTGKSYVFEYIDKFLSDAKNDTNSSAGRMLASAIFDSDLFKTLDKRVEEEQNKNVDFQLYRIRQTLYDKQQDVFDNNFDRTIMSMCGRRSGKSELNQRIILKHALKNKESICLYINRNFDNAITQGFDTMTKLLDSLQISYTSSRGNGVITLFNGTEIFYRGASNTIDIDKFRGISKMACAIIDEAGHLKGLRYLLTEILQPATIDIATSQIILTGTPPRTKNFCYTLWHNQDASIKRYNWNFLNNPFIPNRDTVISEVAKLNGVEENSAFIRREYLGDMDALDDDAKVFNNYKKATTLPPNNKTYDRILFGIDWGYEDDAAIVATLCDKTSKTLYELESWHAPHKAISEIAEVLKQMVDKYTQMYITSKPYMVITDTNEKSAANDLAITYKFKNVSLAYKYNKAQALKQLAQYMTLGNVVIKANDYLDDEADNMVWKRDPETDAIIEELDEEAYHANGMMALLYISRQFSYEVMGMVDTNKQAKGILDDFTK